MRIIGGKYRSRKINMVGIETTRETTDMVRESIFNLLSLIQVKGVGLDLFSGSGAMGLEGLSRGLDFCFFNDLNRKAYKTTLDNIKLMDLMNQTKVFNLEYTKALNLINLKLDFVFLDPPYKLNVINEILKTMIQKDLLNEGAFIIIEADKEFALEEMEEYYLYKERIYGIRKIVILKRK